MLPFFLSLARSATLLGREQAEATNTQNAPSAADTQDASGTSYAQQAASASKTEQTPCTGDAEHASGTEQTQDAQEASNTVDAGVGGSGPSPRLACECLPYS